MRNNNSTIAGDDTNMNSNEVRKSNITDRENEIPLGVTEDVEVKRRAQRNGAYKSNADVSKKSRTRNDIGASLGGILASLSLIDNNNENCGVDSDVCEKEFRRGISLSNRKLYHNRESCHPRESCLATIQPGTTQQIPVKTEETDEKLTEMPLESSSSMILFPTLVAGTTNEAQSIRPQLIRSPTNIHCFTSMMTPSPTRDNEHHPPSTVRIQSSPALPPLGENLSPRYFKQLKNESMSSLASSSTFFSSEVSGGSKTTERSK